MNGSTSLASIIQKSKMLENVKFLSANVMPQEENSKPDLVMDHSQNTETLKIFYIIMSRLCV